MEQFIENIAEILELEEKDVTMSLVFSECEAWDSLAQLSFLALAEDEYDITIDNDKLKQATTIADLFELVKKV